MKVELNLYASLSSYLPDTTRGNSCILDIEEKTTIRDVLDQLKVPAHIPKIIFVNGSHAKDDRQLREGDRVGVFPPVAGG